MFNKKNNKTKTESEYSELAKFHTMKDDLLGGGRGVSEEEIDMPSGGYDTNNGSPFLGSVNNNPRLEQEVELSIKNNSVQEIGIPLEQSKPQNVVNSYPHIPTSKEPDSAESRNEEKMDFSQMGSQQKSSFGYIVIFIIILLLGAGGYYLWSTKGEELSNALGLEGNTVMDTDIKGSNNTSEGNQNSGSSETINDLSGDKNKFSDKVNFMVIGDGELNQAGIKKVLDNKFLEMGKYSGNQVEFLLVDKNNKPILFKDFINSFKIVLSQETINSLAADNFSLFLYRNKDIKRVSMVVAIKDKNLLKISLAKNEKSMVKNLDSLFVYSKPDNSIVKQFGQSDYNGNLIKYINFNKDLNLSLDYGIIGNYLMIATNKDSGRLIIDKISKESTGKKDIFSSEK